MWIATLLVAASLLAQAPSPERAEAERLARSGSYEEALQRFRALAAADPRDADVRLWIGRLHLWMGDPQEAEPVFLGVLASNPDNLDALIGLGTSLTDMRRFDEASAVLTRAEGLAPDDPQVLAAQGNLQRLAGRTSLALAYYERARLLGEDAGIRRGLERTRFVHAHRIEATFVHESFSTPVPDTRNGNLVLDLRINDWFRVHGRGQTQRKFGRTETRGGGGIELRGRQGLFLRGQALYAEDAQVLPEWDGLAEIGNLGRVVDWTLAGRFIRFQGVDVWVVSPGVAVHIRDRATVRGTYHRSLTDFEGLSERIAHNSALVEAGVRVLERLRLDAGYARNVETFDSLSLDRIGEFEADTIIGGLQIDFPSLTSLVGRYEYQWRENDTRMIRVTASLVQRF